MRWNEGSGCFYRACCPCLSDTILLRPSGWQPMCEYFRGPARFPGVADPLAGLLPGSLSLRWWPPTWETALTDCKPTLCQQEALSLPVSHVSQSSVWEPATLIGLSARSSSSGENDIFFLYTIIGFSISLFNSVKFGLYILSLCCLVHIILEFYICLVLLLFFIKHYSSLFLIMNFVLKSIFSWY